MAVTLPNITMREDHPIKVLVPLCLACGNRRSFVIQGTNESVLLTGSALKNLDDFSYVICGRCGSHHSVILDLDA